MAVAQKETSPKNPLREELASALIFIDTLKTRLQEAKDGNPEDNASIDSVITHLEEARLGTIGAIPTIIFELPILPQKESPTSKAVIESPTHSNEPPPKKEPEEPMVVFEHHPSLKTDNPPSKVITTKALIQDEDTTLTTEEIKELTSGELDKDGSFDEFEKHDYVHAYLVAIGAKELLTREQEESLGARIFVAKLALRTLEKLLESDLLPFPQRLQIHELITQGMGRNLVEILESEINEVQNSTLPSKEDFLKEVDGKDQLLVEKLRDFSTIEDVEARKKTVLEFIRQQLDLFNKGVEAFNLFVESNLRLVVYVAKFYRERGLSFFELIQEGNFGLLRAVGKYDYRRGFKFSTYAPWWIKQSISRAIADQGRMIRISAPMKETLNRLIREQRRIWREEGTSLDLHSVAERMGDLSPNVVMALNTFSVESLNRPVDAGEGGTAEFGDFVEDKTAGDIGNTAMAEELKQEVRNALNNLNPRERLVIKLRFGLEDYGRPNTLEEVGKIMGVTKERVRQIEAKALRKLRHPKNSSRLRDFTQFNPTKSRIRTELKGERQTVWGRHH